MIGSFVLMGKDNYIQMNAKGTLEKLPRLRWWQQIYFVFQQAFKGNVHIEEVRRAAKKANERLIAY